MKLLRIAPFLAAGFFIAASAFAADPVRVVNAWAKATVPGQKVAGVYLEILSPLEAKITGVSFHLARSAEIHSMKIENGTMKMRPLKTLDLPRANGSNSNPAACT